MNISGIRPSVGFYNYNEIKKTELNTPQIADTQQPQVQEVATIASPVEDQGSIADRQTFGAYDYANQYNPDTTYELKGVESDINSLDVQKAVSDMQKDQVLHQYQYFVGDAPQTSNGVVSTRGGEDFSL